jgi:phage-related protein (TIGR01555 family)
MIKRQMKISQHIIKAPPPPFGLDAYRPPASMGGAGRGVMLAMDSALRPAMDMLGCWHEHPRFMGYASLLSLAQNPLIRAGVEMLADEMTSRWIKLNRKGEEDKDNNGLPDLEEELRRVKAQEIFRHAVTSCGYFGGCLVYIDAGEDDADLANPLPLDSTTFRKGALKGIKIIEPHNVSPGTFNSTKPWAKDYYKPSFWYVQGTAIHAGRFLYFAMNSLPSLLLPAYNFFGIPLAQTVLDAVKHFTECREAEARLLTKYSMTVLKTDMSKVLQNGFDDEVLRRVQYMVQNRNNDGVEVIDKDNEDIINVTTPLSGVTDIVRQSMEMVAAHFNEPVTKMWGLSPGGFNATGESDLKNHYDHIAGLQKKILYEPLHKLLKILQFNLYGEADDSIDFEFNPLSDEDEQKAAAVQKTKAETAAILIDGGIISPEEERERLANDPDSGYDNIDPYTMPEPPEEESLFGQGEEELFEPGGEEETPASERTLPADLSVPVEDMAFDDDDIEWITVNGTRVPVSKTTGKALGGANGKFTGKKFEAAKKNPVEPLKSGGNKTIIKSLQDVKEVRGVDGKTVALALGTSITRTYIFAGQGGKNPLRVEKHLIAQYGGSPGKWQHGRGTGYVDDNGVRKKVDVHYFYEPSVGYIGVRVKEDDKK